MDDDLRQLLTEVRDNQREALDLQRRQLAIAEQQLERARGQVEESLQLQREAVTRFRRVTFVVMPLVLFLAGLIGWLVLRWF